MFNTGRDVGVRNLEDKSFLLLLIAVSLAFAWILWPFYGAVLWGAIAVILFAPLNHRLLKLMPQRRNLATFTTLLVIVGMVILPAMLIAAFLLQEASDLYERIQSGELDLGRYFQQDLDALPGWVVHLLDRFGLTNLGAVREKLSAGLMSGLQALAAQAFHFGQSTLSFLVGLAVMLYLTFFLLRDGAEVSKHIGKAVPLRAEQRSALFSKFIVVVRAMIKGSIVVAILQGAIGGLIFWGLGIHAPILWAVLMAFLSLLPAVGTGLVWGPVAIFLLMTGAVWQGVILIGCGLFIIGTVDNIVRPILVGKDARMPDYVVLISTLGGLEVFGFNGIVIGPLIAAMFMVAWDIFTASRN